MPTTINMPKARADALVRVLTAITRQISAGGPIEGISDDDRFELLSLSTQLHFAQRNPRDPSERLLVPTPFVLHFAEHLQDYADLAISDLDLSRREVEGIQDLMSTLIKDYGPCDHSVGICNCDLQLTYDQLSDILNRPSVEPSLTVQLDDSLQGDDGYNAAIAHLPNPEEEELK